MKKPLRIYTVVWGDVCLNYMEKGLITSLCWPKNKAALQHAVYSIYTMPSEIERVTEIAARLLPRDKIECKSLLDLLGGAMPTGQAFLFRALINEMHECLSGGDQFLMAPPDTIFSEGSIDTLLAEGEPSGRCVAVAHPRVHPSILDHITERDPVSGDQFVSHTFKNLHRTWSDAEIGRDMVNSYTGGVSWRKLPNGMISVCHRLPTIYLANLQATDLTFFTHPKPGVQQSFGYWDHQWPSELTNCGRQRLIGSSDAAFIVELTEPDENIPMVRPANPWDPTAFSRSEPHNLASFNSAVIFRPG